MPQGPEFYCIGAQKAATTWLAAQLFRHPEIWKPFTKELHYFDTIDDAASREFWRARHAKRIAARVRNLTEGTGAPERIEAFRRIGARDYILTEDWYREVFALTPPGRIAGDFTPRYSAMTAAEIDRLLAFSPAARFIYIIRDPIDRALSQFAMFSEDYMTGDGASPKLEAASRAWVAERRYSRGDYAEFIPRWDARLGESGRLLYLPFGLVRRDPGGFMRRVERFLGIRAFDGYPRAEDRVNPTRGVKAPDWIRAHLEADLAPHRAFLQTRFDAAFLDLLR